MHHLGGLPDFSALRFTRYNQYESMILPMVNYLEAHGVDFQFNTHVTDVRFSCDDAKDDNRKLATEIRLVHENNPAAIDTAEGLPEDGKTAPVADTGREETIPLTENDLVFITHRQPAWPIPPSAARTSQPASHPSSPLVTAGICGRRSRPSRRSSAVPKSSAATRRRATGMSATVTTLDEKILPYIEAICKRDPLSRRRCHGRHRDRQGLQLAALRWTINRQPQFRAQPEGQVCVWLYGLFTDVPGDYVKKPMRDCTGKEICEEWLYHLGVPEEQDRGAGRAYRANTVPCMMPYITAFFMPRADGDRPLVVPEGAVNFAFIGQFAETPRDTIFTTEYSMRTGMEAVYTLLDIDRGVPEVWGSVFDLRVPAERDGASARRQARQRT